MSSQPLVSDISSLLSKPVKLEYYTFAARNTKNSFMKKYPRKQIRNIKVANDCEQIIKRLTPSATKNYEHLSMARMSDITSGALKILNYQVDILIDDICKLMREPSKTDNRIDEFDGSLPTAQFTLDLAKEQRNQQLAEPLAEFSSDSNLMSDGEDFEMACVGLERHMDRMFQFEDTPAQVLEYIANNEEFLLNPPEAGPVEEEHVTTVRFEIPEVLNQENEPTELDILPVAPPIEETIPSSSAAMPIEVEVPDRPRSVDVSIDRRRLLIVDKRTQISAAVFAKRIRQCNINTQPLIVMRIGAQFVEDLLTMPSKIKPTWSKTLLNQWNCSVQERWVLLKRGIIQGGETSEASSSNGSEQPIDPVIEETGPLLVNSTAEGTLLREMQTSRPEERTMGLSNLTILHERTEAQKSIHSPREEIMNNFEERQDPPAVSFGDEIERDPRANEEQSDFVESSLSPDISELLREFISLAINLLERHTTGNEPVAFSELVRSSDFDLQDAIFLFLTYLDLVYRRQVILSQREPFDTLWVQRYHYDDSEQ